LIYKWHKWLAVSAGLATLLWFVSGVVMVLPANLLMKPPAPPRIGKETGPSLQEIRVSIPQAIAAEKIEVTSVTTKRLMGRIFYQVTNAAGYSHLIDAMDGARLEITAEVARKIAATAGADANTAGEAILLRTRDDEYAFGPLPAYKIAGNDGRGTLYFVTAETGEVRSTNTMGRVRGFIAGLHTFDFLGPVDSSGRVARVLLFLFGLIGTAMTAFGAWILCLQFRNWQMRRRAA
jgi:hypothetical protein